MAKTKREYILATCFVSGAAAIISFISLGTQEWVTSNVNSLYNNGTLSADDAFIKFGLFSGTFKQLRGTDAMLELTMVCLWDKNICALLCGDGMSENLEKLYNNETIPTEVTENCAVITSDREAFFRYNKFFVRNSSEQEERVFINTGVWICTVIFLCLSAVVGLFSAGLAVWNTASNPYQVYFSIFGLYIYNAIACFSVLLSIILWGASFAADIKSNDIPTYKTFLEPFTTADLAVLGYSYWINLAALFLYMLSVSLLYIRDYLISREPEVKVQLDDNIDSAIYLY